MNAALASKSPVLHSCVMPTSGVNTVIKVKLIDSAAIMHYIDKYGFATKMEIEINDATFLLL